MLMASDCWEYRPTLNDGARTHMFVTGPIPLGMVRALKESTLP